MNDTKTKRTAANNTFLAATKLTHSAGWHRRFVTLVNAGGEDYAKLVRAHGAEYVDDNERTYTLRGATERVYAPVI